ncbi:sugar ABC transporter permease [Halobacterium sp. KA-4]|uniref:carbohydrate ABC transporter permease n=1 Tax=Halobacterium sp. KA-4 TaxID=2896367 RepID=UPI001E557A95|nr:sugar ABC transporter permease [Halobacterium sp. KA-4]MCD2201461.1 sugar ABC transporter permease [Halobacterium sp. KA-4]
MILPTVLTVFFVTIVPMLWSMWLSFHLWNPSSINPVPRWTGIDNYVWVLTNPRFWDSVVNFLYYGVGGVIFQVALGTILALALHNAVKSQLVKISALVLFTTPMMFAPIIAGNIWTLLFSSSGAVNGILQILGLPAVQWLGSRWLGLTSLLIADTWQWVGLPLIIVYGGRVGLSESMYNAAQIEDASRWMKFRYITYPQLRSLLVVAGLLRFMDLYKLFDKLFIMTSGGPGSATELPTYYAYVVGFNVFNIGRAAAMTWILGLGATLIMMAFWRYIQSSEVSI